jgi:hypothetical protein
MHLSCLTMMWTMGTLANLPAILPASRRVLWMGSSNGPLPILVTSSSGILQMNEKSVGLKFRVKRTKATISDAGVIVHRQ